jgi:D-alanyl-lipoteichoic acid acyltransferase DltB (MBOAT superfamily)
MGYELMKNFDIPYHSRSIAEFWRRWHISLSSWFRDYLYIPLGGNRCGPFRNYLNLLVVFLISGLWHGASWAFILWGGLHGVYLIAGQATYALRQKLWDRAGLAEKGVARTMIAVGGTFHLVLFSWIFFRAGTLHEAKVVLSSMLTFEGDHALFPKTLGLFHQVGLALAMIFLAAAHLFHRRYGLRNLINRMPLATHIALACAGICAIFLWGRFSSHDFIYFQF